MAMVALRDHMKGHNVAVLTAERAARQKDRMVTFVLFWLMAALLVGAMWAGVHGGG